MGTGTEHGIMLTVSLENKSKKLIIFDYDGVIVNSVEWNAKSFVRAFHELGFQEIRTGDFVIGDTLQTQFESVTNQYNINIDDYDTFKKAFEKHHKATRKMVSVNPGLPDAIRLIAHKYPLVIMSNNSKEKIEDVLRKHDLTTSFKQISGLEDKKKRFQGSLKEDRLRTILKDYNCAPEQAVLIEDVPKHIEAAHSIGVDTIAYITKANQHMEFPEYTTKVHSPEELVEELACAK